MSCIVVSRSMLCSSPRFQSSWVSLVSVKMEMNKSFCCEINLQKKNFFKLEFLFISIPIRVAKIPLPFVCCHLAVQLPMFRRAQVSVKWKSINNFAVREMISLHKYFLKPEFLFISIPIGVAKIPLPFVWCRLAVQLPMFRHAQVSVKWKSINNFAVREMISLHKYFLKPEFFLSQYPSGL